MPKQKPVQITIRDIARKLLVSDTESVACIRRVAGCVTAGTLLALANEAETVTDQARRLEAFRLLARRHIPQEQWQQVLGPFTGDGADLVFLSRNATQAHADRSVDPEIRKLMRQKPRR